MAKVAILVVGKKGFEVLISIVEKYGSLIDMVVIGRDSGVENDYSESIQKICDENKLNHIERSSVGDYIEHFDGYIIAIGWRWMLPSKERLIIIHDSLLPKYRGFAPLVNCLINGETEIGATALFAADDYDAGNIINQSSRVVSYPIKISDAIELMAEVYTQLVDQILDQIKSNQYIKSTVQDENISTYSLWRDSEDYWIDWNRSSSEISRFVDAVGSPYAGARCLVNGERAIVRSASSVSDLNILDRNSSIGKVIMVDHEDPVVVCSKGLLKITQLEKEDGQSLLPLSKFRTRFS